MNLKRKLRWILPLLAVLLFGLACRLHAWSHLINAMLPADSRPGEIVFAVDGTTPAGFAALAAEIGGDHSHVELFREAGVLAYAGPSTCLDCHGELAYEDAGGDAHREDLLDNLTGSAHYRFFTTEHPNVWGFNGELADGFAMGKINRPCPKPGSFAMTAWAELVVTQEGDTLSEGCGQCHVGGQYQAPLGEMMPLYATLPRETDAIDCLICHAVLYDMNRKQVVRDPNGRLRWGQDRSLRAALTVTTPTAEACLRCHQHNLGGDLYVDPRGPSYMQSLYEVGDRWPRVRHPGSKRGTPYSPSWDVHAAAGLSCLECHPSEGHRIARGTRTTTLMANDLPGVEISCLDCHDDPPHAADEAVGARLNDHLAVIACTTCHIPSLHPDNVTRRDFAETEWESEPGIFVYRDVEKRHFPGDGIDYVWWNGDCTFLGNPVGDNPRGGRRYTFYDAAHRWPEFADFDYAAWFEEVMRPVAQRKPSKLYAFKRFNGRQHVDLQNVGPFGGMYVPYNLPHYYRHGEPAIAARLEMDRSMMRKMYGRMFELYMLNSFMKYMRIDGWDTGAYDDLRNGRRMEARWLPTDAHLEISHGIRRQGALMCGDCHGPDSVLDWERLGYAEGFRNEIVFEE
jgi:hypothetical protein